MKGKLLSSAQTILAGKAVQTIPIANLWSITMNAKITAVAFLALFAFAGAAAAQDKMSTDSMKTDAMKGDQMKGDAMKGDAMKGDHMKSDATKGDAMKSDGIKHNK